LPGFGAFQHKLRYRRLLIGKHWRCLGELA
jgi:hypothetical protein